MEELARFIEESSPLLKVNSSAPLSACVPSVLKNAPAAPKPRRF
jgi:hypothetical protein